MRKRHNGIWLVVPTLIVLGIGVYYLSPVHSRLAWRVDDLRTRVKYFFSPPDEALFQPAEQAQIEAIVSATMQAIQTAAAPTATPAPTSGATATPTTSPMPLPASVSLPGIVYVDQCNRWNYCGPSNLAMALNFWGWKGSRDDVAKAIKPGENDPKKDFVDRGAKDKNVMPYEMVDFVNAEAGFRALYRYGGEMELVKRLLAAGYPVLIEKGYYEQDYTGKIGWMGHYSFVTGYDDSRKVFIWQDTYPPPQCKGNGRNVLVAYDTFVEGWRSFDYLFIVVYPPEREQEVLAILGLWADPQWAAQHALDTANQETQTLEGIDGFFAWFNKGASHVALQQYVDAAAAYDQAFSIYAGLGGDDKQRPYRIMWYQTGPYWAYYYAGRYMDVINLANTTLNETISEPTLEESLYWRGMAKYMVGDTQGAIGDYRAALAIHTDWGAAVQALQDLGVQP